MREDKSINLDNIESLQGKVLFPTSNSQYILSREYQTVIREPEYKLLGFLNNYCYSSVSGYLAKDTLDGRRIAEIYLEVEHGYFFEGLNIMYFTYGKTLYCINSELEILWKKTFDDNIRNISIDIYGSAYILFENSRLILKYLNTGDEVLYILDSDDPTKDQRLYKSFITNGGGYMYVIGSSFYDYNRVISFIDLYDIRKGELIDHQILFEHKNVKTDDPYYEYYDIRVYGDYIYIYGKEFIKKINIKMIPIWEFSLGYNNETNVPNNLSYIEYDNTSYEEKIYFVEDFYETNGSSIGLLSPNGKLIWKLENISSTADNEFSMCVYNGNLYTSSIQDINSKSSYILSLNDNAIYLKTQDGSLIQIIESNSDEIFLPENYFGQRLLGCQIKDGIEKIISIPMMHDSGPILAEDGEILLTSMENLDYTNDENYNYFYLLTSERLDSPNNISILTTKNGSSLISFFGSAIKTKVPYYDYEAYQNLADDDYNDIETVEGANIAIKSKYYSRNKYLIADRFKFRTAICTKKDKISIATKKHKLLIARKSRYVYKYVLQRLNDIDIIAEFLEQNGVVDTLIPYYVDKLRHHTTHMIEDIQGAGAPNMYNIMATKKFSYKYDGYEYPINTSNTQIYLVKNMPYNKKRENKSIFIDSMANLVLNKEIRPFVLFVGGKAIKWSDMVIVRDWYYTYIVIKNILPSDSNVSTIIFPCTVRYGEDNQVLNNELPHMYFDSNGFITEEADEIAMRIEVIDDHVTGETFQLTSDINYFQLKTNEDQITFNGNIIVFEDYKVFEDSRFYLQSHGNNVYEYLRDTSPIIKTFYYNQANSSKNLLLNIANQEQVNEDVMDRAKGLTSEGNSYVDNFSAQFDFKLSKDKTYARNIAEATRYILTYNMQLLIDYYKDQANFKSYNYTGEQLYNMIPEEGGYLKIPRQRKNGLDDFVIVFHNDKLYEYYKQIEYENRYFKIPIFNHVLREDKIEILHFKNIDNTYYTLTPIKDNPNYIAKSLRHDNFLLFGNSPSGKEIYDDFSIDNNIQYELSFEYKNNWNGNKYINTDIKLDDEYYYNKKINIVSKRQFREMYYNVLETTDTFELEPDFRFCRNQNQYLVFVNGIKLINNEFGIDFMTDDHQVTRMTLIVSNALNPGDYINIIYIPDSYNEILIENYNSDIKNGDINLDTYDLDYPFDKDLFMISIDGKKILNSNIQNISSHRVRLTHIDDSFKQICVNSFLQPDALLKEIFSYGDSWSSAVDSLSKEDYIKLFAKLK